MILVLVTRSCELVRVMMVCWMGGTLMYLTERINGMNCFRENPLNNP